MVGAVGKSVRTETSTVSVAPRVKPELTLPVMYVSLVYFLLFFSPESIDM